MINLGKLRAATPPSASQCANEWWNPFIFFPCIFSGTDAANAYASLQYGETPLPVVAPVGVPTAQQIATLTPDQIQTALAKQQQIDSAAATDQAIRDAIASGAYNPAGNLPATATDLSNVPVWFWVVGGAVVLGIVLEAKR